MRLKIIFLVMVLALVSTACSISFNVPRASLGELVSFQIDEKTPGRDQETNVELQVGAAELTINGGSSKLLEGEIRYNNPDWKPEIKRSDDGIVISQPRMEDLNFLPSGDSRNEWDLKVGSTPMNLIVNAGAYQGEMEFEDYAFTNFTINDGASESKITFKSPNKSDMGDLVYKTGASKVELFGLANANFENMSFDCGAGSYTLDFSGKLIRDAHVSINSGVSNIEILIPKGVNSRINVSGGLNNIDLEGTWTSTNSTYSTEGAGPTITIEIDMGVGNISLVSE
ncbi:MAG: toast rack family protein [Anaerolineaceae bacterium]